MESYKFEFYDEYYGNEIHMITFNGSVSDEHIHNILDLCIQNLYCVGFKHMKEIFFHYLESHHLKYSNFKYNKKTASFKEDKKRFDKFIRRFKDVEFNHYYVIYNNKHLHPIDEYWCSKMHFVAKRDNEYSKILYLEEKYDDEDLFLDFRIFENSDLVHSVKYNTYEYEDEENQYPYNISNMMSCSEKQIKLLQNIDNIYTEEDFLTVRNK